MKKFTAIFFIFIAVCGLFLLYKNLETKNSRYIEKADEEIKIYPGEHNAYSMNPSAYGDLKNTEGFSIANDKIYGGIVSHHFLVAPEIASYFTAFKGQNIKTVVIIGPNHFNAGQNDIQISNYPYNTPWGTLEPNTEIVEKLLEKGTAKNEEGSFKEEHTISALASFVKYYMPRSKIVPIILMRKTSMAEAAKLAKDLEEVLPEDSLVLASVDFSHHLNSTAANFHDTISISTIKSFDFERLRNLEIDSPPSVYTLLKYLNGRGAQKIVYKNTNSAEFMGKPEFQDVTSYTFAYFEKGLPEKENNISILAFGDASFGQNTEKTAKEKMDPLEKIKGIEGNFFRGTDLVSLNLIRSSDPIDKCGFGIDKTVARSLKLDNINLANLNGAYANDCSEKQIIETKKILDNYDINYFNEDPNDYFSKFIGNKKISFVSLSETMTNSDLEDFYTKIKKMKTENTHIVVYIRWNGKGVKIPSGHEINIARRTIDNGADVIIGHGPNAIEPPEIYKNKVIFYSLGDLISDKNSNGSREGVGVGIIFKKEKMQFNIFPFRTTNYQPELLPYKETEKFCNNFLGGAKTTKPCYFELND